MPVFDTPITTDDRNLSKVLGQNVPVAVFLYDSHEKPNKPVEDALNTIARKHAGELLIARVDVATNPDTHRQYGGLQTPALVTLEKGLLSRKVKSQAAAVRPADVRAHVDYLLGKGPAPEERKAPSEKQASSAKAGPVHVTDATFQKVVLESKIPVFVDFWAPWCGPCLSVAPLIDRLAGEYAGRVKIVKLNTDENPATQRRFQVMSIPTFITFRDGRPVERRSGASPQIIRDMIEEVLQKS
jgi:thioredoxin